MKVLFVSEAVTLAQVVRLAVLAKSISAGHDVHFAASAFSPLVFEGTTFRRHVLPSVSPEQVRLSTLRGRRIYNYATLVEYVQHDRKLLEEVRPDLIVGDLRWSLAISAPLAKIPYAALANSYWNTSTFPLPDHPMVGALGERVASVFYPLARPFVFKHFARPVNRLRREHGLSPIGTLSDVLTFGDYTLYADVPSLGAAARSAKEIFLGPVCWSPKIPLPQWWDEVPEGPVAYVTMGSSGRVESLSAIVQGLRAAGLSVLLATAGRGRVPEAEGVWSAEYLPGDLAAKRASLVVCNGGSTTAYQALAEGVPVLGIPSNLDQYLSMRGIVAAGGGVQLRGDSVSADRVRDGARKALALRDGARNLAEIFSEYPAEKTFCDFVNRLPFYRAL